ncbi:MAG: right-handed parallel beta-helix repeat-containing protein, partial [Clostridia bacterium]|nr:right-handed parallel beta-helix repeat-containing protein [Clostridia bacterium]
MEKKSYIKAFGVVAIILAVFALFLCAICYVCVDYQDNRSSLSSDIRQESVTPTADVEWGPAEYDVEYELGESTADLMRSKWDTYVNSSSEANVVKIKLTADWTPTVGNVSKMIPYINGSASARKYVILDLNGHTIKRAGGTGQLIYASYADFTIEDSSGGQGKITGGYTYNRTYGSALYANNCNITLNDVNISNCSLYGNQYGSCCGVVYVEGESNFTMNGGSISDCSGGNYTDNNGIFVNTTLTNSSVVLNRVTFSNNTNSYKRGWMAYLEARNGTVTVTDCTFSGNKGSDHVLNVQASKAIDISGCDFFDNEGIPIFVERSQSSDYVSCTIENCEIYNNINTYNSGIVACGIHVSYVYNAVIRDCNIHDNSGTISPAVYISDGVSGNVSLIRTTVKDNTSSGSTGGVYAGRNAILNIEDSTITGNKSIASSLSTYNAGGGISWYYGKPYTMPAITLSGLVKITDNKVNYNSGADNEQLDIIINLSSNVLKIAGELDEGSQIGVCPTTSSLTSGTAFTSGFGKYNSGKDPADIFFSNMTNYVVAWNTAGTEAAFVTPKTMDKPTADDTNFVYTGSAQTYNPKGIDTTYMKVENNVQVNAGTYTVTVTPVNGCVWTGYTKDPVTFDFVIKKATPKITPSKTSITVAETAEGCVYDISGTSSNGEEVSIAYYDSSNTLLSGPPTAQGTYRIVLSVVATANYNAASVTVPLVITAHKHTFDNYVFDEGSATCTQDGTETGYCTFPDCSESDTRTKEGSALGHDYVGDPTWGWNDAFHTATATFACSRGDEPRHTIAAQVTENKEDATCTKQGLLTFTATVTLNGNTYTDTKSDVISTLPHDYSITSWTWADDNSSATFSYECSECGDNASVTENSTVKVDKAPTCAELGSKTYTVSVTYPYAATATDKKTESIAMIPHNYQDQVFAPTCAADGYTLHTCSVCGDNYRDNEQEALDHDYVNYAHDDNTHWQICSRCGDTSTPVSHTYAYSSTIKEATETEQGEELWACECGSEIHKTTPTLEHTQHTPADVWESDGTYHWHECTFEGCNEQVDKAEHEEETISGVEPTEDSSGLTDGVKCSVCDKILVEQE